nr:magnetosome protein [Desulfamplus magnetovallimortis BW-1]
MREDQWRNVWQRRVLMSSPYVDPFDGVESSEPAAKSKRPSKETIPLSFHIQWPLMQIGNALSGMVNGYKRLFKMSDSDLKAMYLKQAKSMNQKGDTKKCVEFLENVVRIDNRDADIIYRLGVAYEKNGQPDSAIKAYKKVISLAPDNAKAHYRKAVLLIKKQDYENALTDLEEAIQEKPDSAELNFRLGQVNDRLKNYDKAIEYFTRAVELNPQFLAAFKNMALTYDSLNDHEGSLKCLKRALEIEERN